MDRLLSFAWELRFAFGLFAVSLLSLFAFAFTLHPWMLEPFRSIAELTRPARSRAVAFIQRRRALLPRFGPPATFGIPALA